MCQIILRIILAIHFHRRDVTVRLTVIIGLDHNLLAIFQIQRHTFKQRRSQDVLVRTRTNRIEAESRENIPGRSLPVILIPTIAIGSREIKLIHHFTHPILRFPGFTGIVIQVDHMLDRLVAMRIIPHIHNLHFADFMDHTTVIAVIKQRRHIKYGIHHGIETGLSSHQVDQSLRVMENRPGIMPAVAFRKSISPFQRIERRLERTILVAATHQLGLRIEQVLIIHRMFRENSNFGFRFA